MADDADFASNLQERELANIMRNRESIQNIPFSGFCLSCEEPVQNRRYCDSECREDHENRRKK